MALPTGVSPSVALHISLGLPVALHISGLQTKEFNNPKLLNVALPTGEKFFLLKNQKVEKEKFLRKNKRKSWKKGKRKVEEWKRKAEGKNNETLKFFWEKWKWKMESFFFKNVLKTFILGAWLAGLFFCGS